MRAPNPKVELASGEYDVEKASARERGYPHTITLSVIEKRMGLKPRALCNYRANYISRDTIRRRIVKRSTKNSRNLERQNTTQ